MTTRPDHILLLAGTFEARQLAKELAREFPHVRITASFAGVVRDLPDLGVETRVGGFGGVAGLASYLKAEDISLIIDATHPFAAQMSTQTCEAAKQANIPLIRLERPAWREGAGDTWHYVAGMKEAASALPPDARAFLAVGRKEVGAFTHRDDCFGLVRMIEPPELPLPDHWQLILTRPPQSVEAELDLFKKHRISHVVTKNSGGGRSYAKIEAARMLGLPVIMIARPALPDADSADTLQAVLDKTRQFLRT